MRLAGHAIEVRLYAEDAYAGFLPQTGRDRRLAARPTGPGVRIDHGMKDGLAISPFYDPMIAKVIARGATREEARARLIKALRDTVVLGPDHQPAFPDPPAGASRVRRRQGDDGVPRQARVRRARGHRRALDSSAASLLWQQSAARYPATCAAGATPIPSRRRSGSPSATRNARCSVTDADAPRRRRTSSTATTSSSISTRFTVRFQDRTYMPPASAAAGSDGKLRAPMDGRIVAIKVAAGDKVVRGQTLVVLEAMKIQHQLKAALDAKVESIAVQEGQQVANRTVLVTMAADAAAR